MKQPIPDDYSPGEGLTCFKVYWPDTPRWVGILQGLLTAVQQGRIWDEKTGSLLEVISIGWEIEQATLPLQLCCEDCNDDQSSEREVIYVDMGDCLGECELDMSGCSVPYGALRWNNGVLEYRYCGEWYPVSGVDGELTEGDAPTTNPPPVTNPYEDTDLEPEDWSTCGKVSALIDAFIELSDAAWENYEDLTSIEIAMRAAVPTATLSRARIYQWPAQIAVLDTVMNQEWWNSQDMIDNAKCLALGMVKPGPSADGDDVEGVLNALAQAMLIKYGTIPEVYYYSYWWFCRETIGATDCRNIMALGASNTEAECDCPDFSGEEAYDGIIWFTGTGTILQGQGNLTIWRSGNNGKWIELNWYINPGETMRNNDQNQNLNLMGEGTISAITFYIEKCDGVVIPAKVGDIETVDIDPSNYCKLASNPFYGKTVTYTYTEDRVLAEVNMGGDTVEANVGLTLVTRGLFQHPWHTGWAGGNQRFRVGIYSVNGEVYD
jgi:hypothetical protein